MFSLNLQEKQLSILNISDTTVEVCRAFLRYIYGNIEHEEFQTHRLALLQAADKYDILNLKEACHESLMEDIDAKNVLERIQSANLYQLHMLKSSCIRYLVKFGKMYDIRHDLNAFLQYADREFIADIFNEVLNTWKGF
ncbi:BTB/POZ domain-containing protein [Hibiscus syriacus]|uniref:BTB/POZ domain-containing protein n=1 Tax=Hibiscus syriacus TaxID=106335 RepID=A0A6A3AZ39_HIBSY|nr:BTB/POZ domain-containing protein [Hibiscus syriacus]